MAAVDQLDLLPQELGFALKLEQREALESLLRGKYVFLCPTDRIWQKPYLSDVCSCKEFFKFHARADHHNVILSSPLIKVLWTNK